LLNPGNKLHQYCFPDVVIISAAGIFSPNPLFEFSRVAMAKSQTKWKARSAIGRIWALDFL